MGENMPPVKMAFPRVMISDNYYCTRIIDVQRSLGERQTLKVPTRKLKYLLLCHRDMFRRDLHNEV